MTTDGLIDDLVGTLTQAVLRDGLTMDEVETALRGLAERLAGERINAVLVQVARCVSEGDNHVRA